MYIFKNAYLSIIRGKGRNILIGIIVTIITVGALIAITINKSGNDLIDSYIEDNKLAVSFQLNTMELRGATDDIKEAFKTLSVDSIKKYADSDYIEGYYYTLQAMLSSSDIEAIDDSTMKFEDESKNVVTNEFGPDGRGGNTNFRSMGDFRFTAYSDFSYLEDFLNGNKKIISGSMIEATNTENAIVISEELAKENELKTGDEVTFYLPEDEDTVFTYKIVGIYEEVTKEEDNNSFMGMKGMTSSNTIYTNITSLNAITLATEDDSYTTTGPIRIMAGNGLTAKFYLKNKDNLEKFESEVKEKGLSNYYQLVTNEEEILANLKPIQNLSDYSFSFLIVILIIGAIVLGVINMINIRERKYEIGVLRAIGMKKSKVAMQLVSEILMVAFVALIIGTTLGIALSQPVTDRLLASEIESYKESQNQINENFGSGNFTRGPGGGGMMQQRVNNANGNYVESLALNVDGATIGKVLLASLILVSVSGLVSVMSINKYDPNKILQNRS